MDAVTLRQYETLSPFEIKNDLAKVAAKTAKASQVAYLNAGRGNPNWIATEPRSAFFLLGQFAITREPARRCSLLPASAAWPRLPASRHVLPPGSRRSGTAPGAAAAPRPHSVGDRRSSTSKQMRSSTSWSTRSSATTTRCRTACSCTTSSIVREYLQWAMCGDPRPDGTFDLYAVEGGTAAMCYLFKSLKANRLLNHGDTIAMVTPIFTPYLEMPHLEDYGLAHSSPSRRARSSAGSSPTPTSPRCSIPRQGVLRRQSGKPVRGGAQPRIDRRDRPRPREAPRSHAADRRRLRDLRARLPIAARRVSPGTRSASTPTASTSAARAGVSA